MRTINKITIMFFNPKQVEKFAQEAQLSAKQMHQLMFPPRSKRNVKTHREVFIPPNLTNHLADECQKNNNTISNNRNSLAPFKLMKSNQHKKLSPLESEIQRFFQKIQETEISKTSEISETQLRNYMLFQPILKCPQKVKACLVFYNLIKRKGSFLDLLANNKLKQAVNQFQQHMGLLQKYPQQLYLELYRRYILAYQLFKSHKLKVKQAVNVDRVKFFTHQQVDKIIAEGTQNTEFNKDIFVIEDFGSYVGFDNNILGTQYFKKNYGSNLIDTRIQRSDAYGFDVFSLSLYNASQQMKISQYLAYQVFEGTPEVKKCPLYKRLKRNQVCFAVNVELVGKDEIEKQIHKKLEKVKFVQYLNQLDALSYCQGCIPGCNQPQYYFKVKGVWTGGHQENVAMSSVNVNLGPDDSEWYSLDIKYVPKFRKQVLKQFKIDVIQHQGLWFAPPEWLMLNDYPIKKLIQKKGDLVYSGPGTLHWVRSLGKCTQIAWNVFPKTERQWRQATTRMRINEQINFDHVFMPLKSLAIKILNHEYKKRTPFVQAIEHSLIGWIKQQTDEINTYLTNISQLRPKYRELKDINSLCQNCRHEVLTIYSLDVDQRTVCIKCYSQQTSNLRKKLYYKHNYVDIKNLLVKIKKLRQCDENEEYVEIEQLCCKYYCGAVQCQYFQQTNEASGSQENQTVDKNTQTKQHAQNFSANSYTNSPNKASQAFQGIDQVFPHVDAEELIKLISLNLPKCSWNSTEDVIKAQVSIMEENGYLPVKKLKLSNQVSGFSHRNDSSGKNIFKEQ